MTSQRMRLSQQGDHRFDRLPHHIHHIGIEARILTTSTGSLGLRALGIIPEATQRPVDPSPTRAAPKRSQHLGALIGHRRTSARRARLDQCGERTLDRDRDH